MILLLLACDPSVETDPKDTDTTADTAETGTTAAYTLALATTSSDFMSGAFAAWDPLHGLSDTLLSIGTDVALRADGQTLFLLTRSTENTVRVYEGLDWAAPALEFSTGDASNPHDLATCGGTRVVSLYKEGNLGLFDDGGNRVGTVDLSAFADGDGSGEPDSMYVSAAGFLYVAMNNYDYTIGTSTSGALVKVDCDGWTVVDSWDVGPNVRLRHATALPGSLYVFTGNYFDPEDYSMELDGEVQVFDTTTDTFGDWRLTEAELGYNIDNVVQSGDITVVMRNDGYSWNPACIDADQALTEGPWADHSVYTGSMLAAPDGRVWIAARPGYGDAAPLSGLVSLDPTTCAQLDVITTTFPPSSVAVLQ